MPILSEIDRLNTAKRGIATGLQTLGAEVPSNSRLSDYSTIFKTTNETIIEKLDKIINSSGATKEVTLGTTWGGDKINGFTQVINVDGITELDDVKFAVKKSGTVEEMNQQQSEYDKLINSTTSNGTVIFVATEPTTITLTLIMKGF